MSKIPREEARSLVESVDLAIGQQTNIHHCKQGKGNDKLYIKRVNNGSILFCHHCGQSGFVPSNGILAKFIEKEIRKDGNVASGYGSERSLASIPTGQENDSRYGQEGSGESYGGVPFSLPRDASRNIRGWDSHYPKLWLTRYGVKINTLKDFEIYWSEEMGALIFPQRHNGELVGYQYRFFPPKEGFPKYLTKTKSNFDRKNRYLDDIIPNSIPNITSTSSNNDERIIIVEDYISAIRIAALGYPACPLWGSQLHNGQLTYLLQKYNKFVIMLDNDNSQVKTKQRRIKDRLLAHGAEVKLCLLNKDPKEYTDEELIKVLN